MPFFSIWCVAHRITLGWKSVCVDNPIVVNSINHASQLCTFFHNSGERTAKLRNAAKANNLSEPMNYPSFNSTRWVQYAYNLLYVILRNWRSSMMYFLNENEQMLADYWGNYHHIHLLTFLCDILKLLKTFQKTFESDTNTILELPIKKQQLFECLQHCIGDSLENGWEQFFLAECQYESGEVYFFGHKLITKGRTRNSSNTQTFTFEKRQAIIQSLLKYLDRRFECDDFIQKSLKPLHPILITSSIDSLKLCHQFIASDFDESSFMAEYYGILYLLHNFI